MQLAYTVCTAGVTTTEKEKEDEDETDGRPTGRSCGSLLFSSSASISFDSAQLLIRTPLGLSQHKPLKNMVHRRVYARVCACVRVSIAGAIQSIRTLSGCF